MVGKAGETGGGRRQGLSADQAAPGGALGWGPQLALLVSGLMGGNHEFLLRPCLADGPEKGPHGFIM